MIYQIFWLKFITQYSVSIEFGSKSMMNKIGTTKTKLKIQDVATRAKVLWKNGCFLMPNLKVQELLLYGHSMLSKTNVEWLGTCYSFSVFAPPALNLQFCFHEFIFNFSNKSTTFLSCTLQSIITQSKSWRNIKKCAW